MSFACLFLCYGSDEMNRNKQMHAPVYEALERLKRRRVVPFDVPDINGEEETRSWWKLLGEKCVSLDVNSMKPLDNLCHPVSVIKEAEELAAEAFRAAHAFFYGWRNNIFCAKHGTFLLQGRRQKLFYPETCIRV